MSGPPDALDAFLATEPLDTGDGDTPAKPPRNPALALFAVILSVLIIGQVWADALYFVRGGDAVDIGNTMEGTLAGGRLANNLFVTVAGPPDPRMAEIGRAGAEIDVFNLTGSWIFVARPRTERPADGYGIFQGQGRLLSLEDSPRYFPLKEFFATRFNLKVPAQSWVLEYGRTPGSMWQAALIAVLMFGLIAWNAWGLWRWWRWRQAS